jgi:hypothetical protein
VPVGAGTRTPGRTVGSKALALPELWPQSHGL